MMSPDYEKIVQGGKYLASKQPAGKIPRLLAVKLMFLADRYHLRKYGRPITWDNYVSIKWGPAGSDIMNLFKQNETWLDENKLAYSVEHLQIIGPYDFEPKGEIDDGVFSDTDLEALDFAHNRFGHYDQFALAKELTHLFPEWYIHRKIAEVSQVVIEFQEFFGDPDAAHPLIDQDAFRKHGEAIQVFREMLDPRAEDIFSDNRGNALA